MSSKPTSVYDFTATTITGQPQPLRDFAGQVLLIVNVASQCGLTPQYQGLQTLQSRHHERGFTVLGFPCNQFGNQEPGEEAEIAEFCTTRFEVNFPLFAKIEVNGDQAHPLFQYLKSEAPGLMGSRAVKWNFTKFLVDRQGRVTARYAPQTAPEALERDITALLDAPPVADGDG
ncbi:glutathione peroxidase [Halorhodospira abdelmalekii]|uniref:glutathione peroxidase n=1 Tax=Halorhodospira abdelmalekii TaxID=421629 RepID=UPI001907FD6E|nr:glutathione peroxidase [Halorhodospira abdelmalekii]MBK1735792.1 glutathione peroxidase [Halorhodospira abdelmalekii]